MLLRIPLWDDELQHRYAPKEKDDEIGHKEKLLKEKDYEIKHKDALLKENGSLLKEKRRRYLAHGLAPEGN